MGGAKGVREKGAGMEKTGEELGAEPSLPSFCSLPGSGCRAFSALHHTTSAPPALEKPLLACSSSGKLTLSNSSDEEKFPWLPSLHSSLCLGCPESLA